MVPVTPDGTAPAECAVHRSRHADGQAPEAADERLSVIRLNDQMEVIVLGAEMENPEAGVGGRGQRAADRQEHPRGPEDGSPAQPEA